MIITRQRGKGDKYYRYYLDGKKIGVTALARICRKYLTDAGMDAMWKQAIDNKKCVLELGEVDDEENKLLEEKISELEFERAKVARLEQKLVQAKLDAASYVLRHA